MMVYIGNTGHIYPTRRRAAIPPPRLLKKRHQKSSKQLTNFDGKAIQNRSQNRQKINQKSIKNHPKIIPGVVLERLGAVLGRLGGLEPSSWRPGAILEPSQERLGASRTRLGGVLGASWGRLRAFGGRPRGLLGRLGASRERLGAS